MASPALLTQYSPRLVEIISAETDVTNDDMSLTGKIAWAHLKEFPDYYTRLDKLEAEADAHWAARRQGNVEQPSRRDAPDGGME